MRSPEERPIAEWMNPYIELYLNEARPILLEHVQAADRRFMDFL